MGDYCRIEQRIRLQKSPWIPPPTPKKKCAEDADLRDWYTEEPHGTLYFFDISTPSAPVALLAGPDDDDRGRQIFEQLASEWKQETWFLSSVKKRTAHLAYRKIIGMGRPALKYIFEALKKEPDYWFDALESISRENPAPKAEGMSELRDAWLKWGAAHGY